MKQTSAEKKAYKAALNELREHYKEELEENIKTLVGIRNDPKVGANVKVDAIRYLNQMLGVPRSPQEKPPEPPPPSPKESVPDIVRQELVDYLDAIAPRR